MMSIPSIRPIGFVIVSISILMSGLSVPALAQSPTPFPKPELRGLVSMGQLEFLNNPSLVPDNSLAALNQVPGVFAGVAINVTWNQIQPTDANSFDFSTIDNALDAIQTYNATYPDTPLHGKLRVFAGASSPDWVKYLGGAPVVSVHPIGSTGNTDTETIARFWSKPYHDAWQKLQVALAKKYDDNPLITTVAVSSCSSDTDESFNFARNAVSVANMVQAGFTNQQFEDCLRSMFDDNAAAWKHSYLEFTFNIFRVVVGKGWRDELAFAPQMMALCRQKLGTRCVLSHHCLGFCNDPGIESAFKKLGAPVCFQPYAPTTLVSELTLADKLVDQAVADHASSLEIWPSKKDGFTNVPLDHLQAWAAKLNSVPPAVVINATPAVGVP